MEESRGISSHDYRILSTSWMRLNLRNHLSFVSVRKRGWGGCSTARTVGLLWAARLGLAAGQSLWWWGRSCIRPQFPPQAWSWPHPWDNIPSHPQRGAQWPRIGLSPSASWLPCSWLGWWDRPWMPSPEVPPTMGSPQWSWTPGSHRLSQHPGREQPSAALCVSWPCAPSAKPPGWRMPPGTLHWVQPVEMK